MGTQGLGVLAREGASGGDLVVWYSEGLDPAPPTSTTLCVCVCVSRVISLQALPHIVFYVEPLLVVFYSSSLVGALAFIRVESHQETLSRV